MKIRFFSNYNSLPINKNQFIRSKFPFHVMLKPVGAKCNLSCKYCYYPQQNKEDKMDTDLLEQFIQQYIKSQPKYINEINFVWHGGEPLLAGLRFYQQAITLQQKYVTNNIKITNTIQTNATLLNDKWCLFLKENHFIVGVSLDGDMDNNSHRPTLQNRNSYPTVLEGVKLLQKYHIDINLLVVVHDYMKDQAIKIYDHLVSLGIKYLQFQPLVSAGNAVINEYKLTAPVWGNFMRDIYQHWQSQQHVGKIFVMNIEHAYAQYFTSISPSCVHAPQCGNNLMMNSTGQLYACDHLHYDRYHLGKLHPNEQLVNYVSIASNMQFGQNKSKRTECTPCDVKMICQGGCPAHLNNQEQNILCEGYYIFFKTIIDALAPYQRNFSGLAKWRETFIQS